MKDAQQRSTPFHVTDPDIVDEIISILTDATGDDD